MASNREQRRKAELARRKQQDEVARRPQQQQESEPTALQILHQQQLSWSGPIPSPEDLEHYERVHSGLAERIVVMAERQIDMASTQMEHRIGVESKHMRGLNRRADVGLWMAFVLALVVLLGGMFLVYNDHDAAGTAIISSRSTLSASSGCSSTEGGISPAGSVRPDPLGVAGPAGAV